MSPTRSETFGAWPRELFFVLLVIPPVLGLIFEPDGLRYGWLHQARSLLAIWVYTLALGAAIHVSTNAISRRWPRLLVGPLGAAIHVAFTLLLVSFVTLVMIRPLVWTCPGIGHREFTLWMRGMTLSACFVLLGRLYQHVMRTREEAAVLQVRSEQALSEARYQALVSRTQPHFLHNALTAAAGLVPTDPKAAENALRDLGSLFREIVDGTTKPVLRAGDEVETARRYLRVQEMRFAGRLDVVIDEDALTQDELVPSLILLPLVENAVLHGLSDGGRCHVRVTCALTAEHVRFTVEDDGPGQHSTHREGTGIGLHDVRARLATLYGTRGSLVTRSRELDSKRPGFLAEILIPREDE
jgi:sensor histidine kinase YesM